jgi:NAD(P)-dependent dehydrogenase (short-subunit alcohol dehydrogenase family)
VPSVLITGASRGIGRASALRLADCGWQVYAGVRSTEQGALLQSERPAGRIQPVSLDLRDERQIADLPNLVGGELDALVNNAGIVVGGPVEALSIGNLRDQLEVNVVAQVAVTQAVLPLLRSSKGRVVFLSSISGRVSAPFLGAYTASKFAIEAIADSLRMELRSWGIRVVLVEPGSIDTDMWRGALDEADETEAQMAPEHRTLYADQLAGMRKAITGIQKRTSPVDKVAAAVERALMAARPKPRYLVGTDARVQVALNGALPTRAMDAAIIKATTG